MQAAYETYIGLAQQFFVPDPTGIFLTSIDLYFQNKDSNIPVTIQLRTMVGGVPSNVVIPFSEVTLDPENIKISADASDPTNFKFPSPVYLPGPLNQEVRQSTIIPSQAQQYAVVVLSNSRTHKLFIAQQGEVSLENNTLISQELGRSGTLFKTQNASTWMPSIIESLKYNLYRADFDQEGLVRFFNPTLSLANGGIYVTGPNQILTLDKRISIGVGTTIQQTSEVKPGIDIKQGTASGKVVSFGSSIVNGSNLNIVNSGIGYTDGTFSNVDLISLTGYGKNVKATIEVSSGTIGTAVVTSPGFGYALDDLLEVPSLGQNIGYGGLLSVSSISDINSINLSNVSGNFSSGITSLTYINSSNVETILGSGTSVTTVIEDPYYTGNHLKISHYTHSMYSKENFVDIFNFRPSSSEVNSRLSQDFIINSSSINLDSTSGFELFEGLPVDPSNPGYVILGKEIIEYTGFASSSLTGITRNIEFIDDNTSNSNIVSTVPLYSSGSLVFKYELNGISLRRINKTHNFADIDTDIHKIDTDSYHIKIDVSSKGKDRTNTGLYFNSSVYTGDVGICISQNIQFNSITPKIKNIIPNFTRLEPKVRTISATSVNGNENSFEIKGFDNIVLNRTTNFSGPRLIASKVNESNFDFESPGNRSFELDYYMNTSDSRVSPVLDLEDPFVILASNRINNPISDYSSDERIRSIDNDPHEFVYVSKPISLEIPANAIKVYLTANLSISNDIRVLYRIFRNDVKSINYELFPGYLNYTIDQDGIKRVIDSSKNDGSADSFYIVDSISRDYDLEYSAEDLPEFNAFSIKIVGSTSNQSIPPIIKLLRAISTRKPS